MEKHAYGEISVKLYYVIYYVILYNITDNVNKSKCDITMHLLMQPHHFSLIFKSLSSFMATHVSWDLYLSTQHCEFNSVPGAQPSKFTVSEMSHNGAGYVMQKFTFIFKKVFYMQH